VADSPIELPPDLRARIARDLDRVVPLAPPARRAIVVLPISAALLVAAAVVFGLRRDAIHLGLMLTWGASTAQMLLGVALVVAALRESVPGTTLPRRVAGMIFGTVLIAVLAITFLTWTSSPTTIARGSVISVWGICLTGTIVSALPALAVTGWLVARAFPLRPRLAGALYGVGAGLMADAGWRLFCHFSDPVHVLGAHAFGVLVTGLLGIGLATRLVRSRR
jgi:hypothetical protein